MRSKQCFSSSPSTAHVRSVCRDFKPFHRAWRSAKPVQGFGHFASISVLPVLDGLLSKANHLPGSAAGEGQMLLVASLCPLLLQALVICHLLSVSCLILSPQLPAKSQQNWLTNYYIV